MENLMSISEHSDWLESLKNMHDYERWELHRKRVEFGKQKLSIHQFIPCKLVGDVWVVLKEPKDYSLWLKAVEINDLNYFAHGWGKCVEYQEAKSKCLFEGWKFEHEFPGTIVIKNEFGNYFTFYKSDYKIHIKTDKTLEIIENLVKYKPKLTAKAKQEIGL